jgi:hypothetical protein
MEGKEWREVHRSGRGKRGEESGGEVEEQIKGKGRCMGDGEKGRGKWEMSDRVREDREEEREGGSER